MFRFKLSISVVVASCFFSASSLVFALGTNDALEISAHGVMVQKFRVNLIAKNVANAFTLMTDKGVPYTKQYAVIVSDRNGPKVQGVAESNEPFGKVYDPSHPFSNKYGFIHIPNVNLAEEMVDLVYTNVLYEANTTAFKSARTMYQQALELVK